MVKRIITSKSGQNQCFSGRTDIFKCYKNYIMSQHRPHKLQRMPGHRVDVMPEFTG